MLSSLALTMVLGQTAGIGTFGDVLTVSTGSTSADGATFYVKATTTLASTSNSYAGGIVTGTSYVYFVLGESVSGTPNSFSEAQALDFYFCGSYSGPAASIPTSIVAQIPKTETSQASSSGSGSSSSGSTSNTSETASGSQSNSPQTFSNTDFEAASGLSWQQQPNGSYTFNNYAFTNNMAAAATVTHIGKYNGGSGSGKVQFALGSVTASH